MGDNIERRDTSQQLRRGTMARTSDKTSARNRARQALADKQRKRRERDERMELAATRYFAAADAIDKARRDAGEAIQALVSEGEARAEIADMLGITTRDIKIALDALPTANQNNGAGADVSAPPVPDSDPDDVAEDHQVA